MSNHHHNHHHQPCCCNSYNCSNTCTPCCCSSHRPPNSTHQSNPNPNSNSDQLLQALTTHLLIQSQPQPQSRSHNIYLKKPLKTPISNSKDDHHHHLSLLRSLIQRVAALESSLSNSNANKDQPQSLKHLAAVTIQRHFRRFLARRSRTLRDLKELATVKSHAAALRSALTDRAGRRDARALLQRAMDLLLRLDAIQSSDLMIREGKRSIGRELVRISEFVEKVLMREQEEEEEDELNEREFHSKHGSRVRFLESRNEHQVYDDLPDTSLAEENGDEEEETNFRGLGIYDEFSGGNERLEVSYGVNGGFQQQQQRRRSGLAAPKPVQMEARRSGSMDKVAIER